jgi:3-oxoacyl-[acyl-carrier-protein] synthase-3
MKAAVTAIACHLPDRKETIAELARPFADWQVERIVAKTGIEGRHLAAPEECSSDLAVQAAEKLFRSGACRREEIDFVLLCTQTPDYILPTTACLVQHRLGLPQTAGALDFNLGCSGYVYGLSLAKGLVETGQARTVLLLTAETYSKLARPADRNVSAIFGDAAAATLVRLCPADDPVTAGPPLGPFVFGTDGSGAGNLIVREGGFRHRRAPGVAPVVAGDVQLEMNGPEIFNFTLRVVPDCVSQLLRQTNRTVADVDLVVPHQANAFMLDHLRQKLDVPADKFFIGLKDCGNTVSASIPLALARAAGEGRLQRDSLVMLLGFGVGYSWGGCFMRWRATF